MSEKNKHIPSKYFEELESKLFDNISNEEVFDWIDYPIVASKKEMNPFKVAVDYFDILKKPKLNKRPIQLSKVSKWFSYAAVFLVVIGATFLINENTTNNDSSLQELSDAEVLEYMIDDRDNFLLDEFEEFSDVKTLDNYSISPEDILNYFEEEIETKDLEIFYN